MGEWEDDRHAVPIDHRHKDRAMGINVISVEVKVRRSGKDIREQSRALHLRAMNMLYEGLKQNSTIVIVPSSAIETMQLGGLAGLTSLSMGLGQEQTIEDTNSLPAAGEPLPVQYLSPALVSNGAESTSQ